MGPNRRRRVARGGGVAALALAAVLVAGCSSGGSTASPRPSTSSTTRAPATTTTTAFTPASLAWHECEQGECATLAVPLDYADPGGRRIDLTVARASTADPDQRIGSLLVNPGGPGAAGLDLVEYVAGQLPTSITDRFDIVSWDPRGAGQSTPVDCGSNLDARFAVDTAPDDPAELAALEAAAANLVNECVRRSGDLLAHISTDDTVQDLDVLRQALGDDGLTYIGYSYGTYIGARYAERFPHRARALVLDGALDPALPVDDVSVQQAVAFDASLGRFFDWCHARSSCAFHGGGDVRAAYDRLTARIDAEPIDAGGRRVGPTQLDLAVGSVMYGGTAEFGRLATALDDLEDGDPGRIRTLYDLYVGRSGGEYDGSWAAFIAIGCADGPNLTLPEMEALQRRAAAEAPELGAANIGLGYECATWPFPPARTGPITIRAATPNPIMVIGTRGDPATPYAWAESLSAQLGNARLLTVEDSTHTASLNGIPCVDDLLSAYLVDLRPPPPGAGCAR